MQSGNRCLLSSAMEMDGRSQFSWKHSWDCSSGTMAALLVGRGGPVRGLWRPSHPTESSAIAHPGPPAVRFGMSPRNLLSLHVYDIAQTGGWLCLCSGSSAFFLPDLRDFLPRCL